MSVDGTVAPLGYRPGLDGLRGIAVALVLLFHADVALFGGGFIGVDIFFVLSGFLITRLLLEEHCRSGRIHVGRFYVRRALRLLPALVVVVAACMVYAHGWLDPTQQGRARHDMVATLTYHMNWKLALTERPPFGLFDHVWSLAIEEQFYFLWPAVVVALAATRRRARSVLVVAVVAAATSALLRLGLSLQGSADRRLHYGFDTHADGLLVGAALAALTVVLAQRRQDVRVPAVVGPLALGALAVAAVTFVNGSDAVFRGGLVLVAVASALVIVDGYGAGPVSRLLSLPALVALGRISYGVYLWHWPVYLVINGDRFDLAAGVLAAVRISVSIAIAALSFRLVEQPFLRMKNRFGTARE